MPLVMMHLKRDLSASLSDPFVARTPMSSLSGVIKLHNCTNSLYSINLHLNKFSIAFQLHVTLIAFLKSLYNVAVSNCSTVLSETAVLQR